MTFDGATIQPWDNARLSVQLDGVRDLMADGRWRTLSEICGKLGYPQASVSSRLRDLRKLKFGEHIVERKHLGDGVWTYRVAGKVVRSPVQLELL